MQLVSLGFDNVVAVSRIVAVASTSAAPMKRLRDQARKNHKLIDVTCGRRSRAIVITDSGHVILSSVQPQTLTQRIEEADATGASSAKSRPGQVTLRSGGLRENADYSRPNQKVKGR